MNKINSVRVLNPDRVDSRIRASYLFFSGSYGLGTTLWKKRR